METLACARLQIREAHRVNVHVYSSGGCATLAQHRRSHMQGVGVTVGRRQFACMALVVALAERTSRRLLYKV